MIKTYLENKMCDDPDAQPQAVIRNNPLRIQQLPTGTIIDYYMPEVIEGLDEFIDFLRAVRDSKPGDEIHIHMNCYGGDVTTAFNIIDVLAIAKADISIYVEGNCCSAATMIMLSGDNWEISPHAYMMIHAWTAGKLGKWQELQASFKFDEKWLQKSFKEMYKDFLTDDEITNVLSGQDIYLTADEIISRLNKYKEKDIAKQELIQSIADKHQTAINKELEIALKNFEKEENKKVSKKRK